MVFLAIREGLKTQKAVGTSHTTLIVLFWAGSDLLSHHKAVPSALRGLTSLFGMGRGEPSRYNHQQFFVHLRQTSLYPPLQAGCIINWQ